MHLLRIGVLELLPRDRPEGRVVDVRRQAEGLVRRPDGARDKARFVGRACSPAVRCLAGQPGGLAVDLEDCCLGAVVGL